MPVPIVDAAQALKANPEKTEDALLKVLLLRPSHWRITFRLWPKSKSAAHYLADFSSHKYSWLHSESTIDFLSHVDVTDLKLRTSEHADSWIGHSLNVAVGVSGRSQPVFLTLK